MKRVVLTFIFALMATCLLTAAPADIRDGVVAYWPLDATDGTTTPDASSFGNHLSLVSMDAGSFATAGMRGNAAMFDGIEDYLTRTHDGNREAGLPIFNARLFTISMWVNGLGTGQGPTPGTEGDKRVFSEGNLGPAMRNPIYTLGTDSRGVDTRNGALDVYGRGDGGGAYINHVLSTGEPFDGTWHHIALVNNDTAFTVYIDGEVDSTFTYTPATTTLNIVALGAVVRDDPAVTFYRGLIDDVILWERALEQSEIQDAMNNGLVTPIPAAPPFINLNPASATLGLGDRHTLSVAAGGLRPLSYQWFKGGAMLAGETGTSLVFTGLQPADSGDYTVEVTNGQGTTTSTAATLTVVPDPAPDLHNSLVNYWPLDVVESGMTPDVAGGTPMMLVNMDATNLQPGKKNSALQFDGAEEYTEKVGGFPIYDNPAHSVSFWVSGGGSQPNRQVYAESSNTGNNTPLFIIGTDNSGDSDLANVFIRTDASVNAVANLNSTRAAFDLLWHHVVWVDNNGQAKLYIDGVVDETVYTYTRGALTLNTTALGAIRRANVGNWYTGLIDEVATWNRALTYTEVQELFNVGLTPPPAPNPPEITGQPQGADVLSGVDIVFSASVVGTAPLHFQWSKDNVPLMDENSTTLTLSSVQVGDSGSYTLTVTNRAGTATSTPAVLMVSQRPPTPSSLCLDVNLRTDIVTAAGFESFTLNGSGDQAVPTVRNYGGLEFTLAGSSSTAMADRRRGTPVAAGDFTDEQLLRDFIFCRGGVGEGLNISFRFMKPSQNYTITVWSFDTGSTGNRVSDWVANGETVREGYAFGGQTLPTSNDDYRFSFTIASDANGTIAIQSIRTAESLDNGGGSSFGSFLNAICIEEAAPDLLITKFEIGAAQINLTFETVNASWEHRVQDNGSLATGSWSDLAGVVFDAPVGNSITAHFAYPAGGSTFYQVIAFPPEPFLAEDFEGADNWTHGGAGDSWERGTPTTGPGAAHSGVNAWATGLGASYAINTAQWLRSPAINLTSATAATLEFWEFRDVEPLFGELAVDFTTVRIFDAANPNGPHLVELTRDVGTQTQWTKRSFALPAEALGKSIIVEFMLTSDDFQPMPQAGWFIDDVSILP